MNDESKQFEARLRRQPGKQIPGEWRTEILAAAGVVEMSARSPRVNRRFWLSTLNPKLSTVLWPHPVAWGALAAIWIFIFAVNFSMRDKSPIVAEKGSLPSPEVLVELRQQQKLYAELLGTVPVHDANRPKAAPRPRTECAGIWTA